MKYRCDFVFYDLPFIMKLENETIRGLVILVFSKRFVKKQQMR